MSTADQVPPIPVQAPSDLESDLRRRHAAEETADKKRLPDDEGNAGVDDDLDDPGLGLLSGKEQAHDDLFSPDRLRRLRLSLRENLAIPFFFFMLGFGQKLPFVASRQYLRRVLQLSPANQGLVLDVIVQIPWSLKLLYAFFSDSCPIRGQRRKPYLFVGIFTCSVSWVVLGAWETPPGTVATCLLMFMATFGLLMSDVMADALVVEKVALERDFSACADPEDARRGSEVGQTQTTVWGLRFTGSFFGMLAGGLLLEYGRFSEQNIFLLQGTLHALVLLPPLVYLRDDDVRGEVYPVPVQLRAIWHTLQDRRVFTLVYFLFVVGAMPNASSAFTNFILGPLKFSDMMYMVLGLVGIVFSTVGIYLYKWLFRGVDLRWFVGIVQVVVALLALVPLVLVFRLNVDWGIPDLPFALGDESLVELVGMLTTMPILIVCAKLCPPKVEACVYSFLTMAVNISFTIGNSVSNVIAAEVGITQTKFESLWVLIVMSAACGLVPAAFVWLLPRTIENTPHVDLRDTSTKSLWGGAAAVFLVVGGLAYSTAHSIAKVSTSNS